MADDQVSTRLTPQQGLLVLRYAAAKLVLKRLENLFLLKYLLLAGGILVVVLDVSKPLGVLLLALFVMAATTQWIVTRIVRRLGAIHRLAELDQFVDGATTSWWPNLRRELKRVGLKRQPWSVLLLASRLAARHLSTEQETALRQIDWRAVLPVGEWQQARQAVARAAAAPPT